MLQIPVIWVGNHVCDISTKEALWKVPPFRGVHRLASWPDSIIFNNRHCRRVVHKFCGYEMYLSLGNSIHISSTCSYLSMSVIATEPPGLPAWLYEAKVFGSHIGKINYQKEAGANA